MVDARTVVLTMKAPNQLLPAALTLVPVVSSQQLAKGDEYRTDLVGTGPYRLAKWDRGQSVTLVRNEGYWGAKPAYRRVEVRAVPEPSSRLADLTAGTSGVVGDLLPSQLPGVAAGGGRVVTGRAVRSAYLQIVPAGPLGRVDVRQALYRAIDRAVLASTIGGPGAEAATSVVPSSSAGYSAQFPLSDHDPAAARELLERSGQATPVQVVLDTTPDMAAAAQLLQAQVQPVGFRMTLNVVPTKADLFDAKRATGDDRARVLLASALDDRTFDALRPFSAVLGNAKTPSDLGYPPDPATQRLIDAYAASPDPRRRTELSGAVQLSSKKSMPAVFLYFPKVVYGASATVCWDVRTPVKIDLTRLRPCAGATGTTVPTGTTG